MNPHEVTKQFESKLAEYTGAPWAVATDNCSNALFLSLMYENVKGKTITIPSHTYMSVPCSIIHAGAKVSFKDSPSVLKGKYQLEPTKVWDSSLSLTSGMYISGSLMCLSFSGPTKIMKLGKGGAILTDNIDAYRWLIKARYSGRNSCRHLDDNFDMLGWNFYMPNDTAARGLLLMCGMPDFNEDVCQEYQDLSKFGVYNDE